MKDFLKLCFARDVARRASITAFIVGTILTGINHGDALAQGQLDTSRVLKIALTICVPYIVSTVSSASTLLSMKKGSS